MGDQWSAPHRDQWSVHHPRCLGRALLPLFPPREEHDPHWQAHYTWQAHVQHVACRRAPVPPGLPWRLQFGRRRRLVCLGVGLLVGALL